MATAEQIKSLLQSHYKNDNERFTSIALQVAAHEARQGHMSIAKEIKDLIDRAKTDGFKVIKINPDSFVNEKGEVYEKENAELLHVIKSQNDRILAILQK